MRSSKTTLRRVQRRDKAARWVVTLGGMAVIASVIAIVVLIVGTVLPLFQPARTRLIATLPLPASLAPRDVAAVGVEMGLDEKKLLVAYLLGRDGTVTFLDLHTGAILRQVATRGEKTAPWRPSSEPAGRVFVGLVRRHDLAGGSGRGGGPRSPQGKPVCTARVRAAIPPEKGPLPVRAVVRTPKDKEGTVTSAALLADNRVVLVRQVREENLAGEVTSKTQRTVLVPKSPGPSARWPWTRAGANLYAGTSNGVLLWWRLDDDGRSPPRR